MSLLVFLLLLCSFALVKDKMQKLSISRREVLPYLLLVTNIEHTIMRTVHETEKSPYFFFSREFTRRSTTGCRNTHSQISRYLGLLLSHKILSLSRTFTFSNFHFLKVSLSQNFTFSIRS